MGGPACEQSERLKPPDPLPLLAQAARLLLGHPFRRQAQQRALDTLHRPVPAPQGGHLQGDWHVASALRADLQSRPARAPGVPGLRQAGNEASSRLGAQQLLERGTQHLRCGVPQEIEPGAVHVEDPTFTVERMARNG